MAELQIPITLKVNKIIQCDTQGYDAIKSLAELADRLAAFHREEARILEEMKSQFQRITLTAEMDKVILEEDS